MISAHAIVKAQFYDLDPMNVVWHGNYARFLEEARCELLDLIGYNYVAMAESGYAWPIVDMRVKFVRSVRFGQRMKITATLVEYENRLRITYRITDFETGEVLTKAETVQFPVSLTTGEVSLDSPQQLIECVRSLLP